MYYNGADKQVIDNKSCIIVVPFHQHGKSSTAKVISAMNIGVDNECG